MSRSTIRISAASAVLAAAALAAGLALAAGAHPRTPRSEGRAATRAPVQGAQLPEAARGAPRPAVGAPASRGAEGTLIPSGSYCPIDAGARARCAATSEGGVSLGR